MSKFCGECGTQLRDEAAFCPNCGAVYSTVAPQSPSAEKAHAEEERKGFFGELIYLITHPLQLLPIIVISAIWILISLLSAFVKDVPVIGVLASLTYSNGGMFGGVLGAAGGIFGKAVMGVAINAFVLSVFQKKNPFKGFKSGFKKTGGQAAYSGLSAVAPFLIGSGAAVLLYLFFNITSTPQNSAVAVVGAVAAIRAAGTRNGVFFSILFTVMNKLTRGKMLSQMTVSRALTGVSAGFAVGMPVTFARLPWALLAIGGGLLVVGVVCAIVGRLGTKSMAALSVAAFIALTSALIPFGTVRARAEDEALESFSMTLVDDGKAHDFISQHTLNDQLYHAFKEAGEIKVTVTDDKLSFTVPAYSKTITSDDYVQELTMEKISFSAPIFERKTAEIDKGPSDWYETYAGIDSTVTIKFDRSSANSDNSATQYAIMHKEQYVEYMELGLAVENRDDGIYLYTGGTDAQKPGVSADESFEAMWTGKAKEQWEASDGSLGEETSEIIPPDGKPKRGWFGNSLVFKVKGGSFFTAAPEEGGAKKTPKKASEKMPPEVAQIIMISVLTSLLGGGIGALLTALGIVLGNITPIPPSPPSPPNPPETPREDLGPYIKRDSDGDLNVRDPATGETRVYVSNGDGTYTNPLTGATYTPQELKDSLDSRADNASLIRQDQKAAQAAIEQQRADNQKLSQDAKDYLNQKHQEEAKQREEDKLFKAWLKYGGSDDWRDSDAIRKKMDERQKTNVELQKGAHRVASHLDTVVKVAETTQVAADIGVDVLATVTGAQGIKTAYTVGKNYASRLSDAVVNNKDVSGALAMAGFDSLADIAMDKLEGAGYHVSGNAAGETFKQITQNLYEGKDWDQNLGQAVVKGGAKGLIAKTGSALSGAQAAHTKTQLKTDLNVVLRSQYKGMSPKGVRALRDARLITYVNNLHAEQAMNVATTVGTDIGKTTVDGISDAYSDLFE